MQHDSLGRQFIKKGSRVHLENQLELNPVVRTDSLLLQAPEVLPFCGSLSMHVPELLFVCTPIKTSALQLCNQWCALDVGFMLFHCRYLGIGTLCGQGRCPAHANRVFKAAVCFGHDAAVVSMAWSSTSHHKAVVALFCACGNRPDSNDDLVFRSGAGARRQDHCH